MSAIRDSFAVMSAFSTALVFSSDGYVYSYMPTDALT